MNQESASHVCLRITNANGVFFYAMHTEHIKGWISYVVENNWHDLLGVCDFFSLLWFSTINGQLWGTEFYCKKGLLKDFYEKFILSGQNLYNSEDYIGEDGKLTYSYDLSREGILFERRVRYI